MHQRGMVRPYSQQLDLLFRLWDIFLILVCLWIATAIRGIAFGEKYLIAGVIASLCFVLISSGRGIYASWRLHPIAHELGEIWSSWIFTCAILLIVGFTLKSTGAYSRVAISMWFISSPAAICLWRIGIRIALRWLRKRGRNTRIAAIAGAGGLGMRLAEAILSRPELGIVLKGFYDDKVPVGTEIKRESNLKVLGNLDDVVEHAGKGEIDIVCFALPMRAEQRIIEITGQLADTVVSIYLAPNLFVFDLVQSRLLCLDGIPMISICESPFLGMTGWLKRVEDIVISIAVLAVSALPMLLIASMIKLTSKGPVLFKQRRYGIDGREVCVWKFRTMTVSEDGKNVHQARKNDPRVTPIGKFLRRTSLDELPQFINVLQGRMSVVGPRPHAVAHNEEYRRLIHGYMRRHKVKPGITGLAQVNGYRGRTETIDKMEKRIECDMEYIRNWSLLLDVKILAKTLIKGLWNENAY